MKKFWLVSAVLALAWSGSAVASNIVIVEGESMTYLARVAIGNTVNTNPHVVEATVDRTNGKVFLAAKSPGTATYILKSQSDDDLEETLSVRVISKEVDQLRNEAYERISDIEGVWLAPKGSTVYIGGTVNDELSCERIEKLAEHDHIESNVTCKSRDETP